VVNGKWTIDARLGSGGMATVYAATHRNGHSAALKMLHPALSRDASTRARFLREGYLANAVGHPGVVRVEDDGVTEDGIAFLVLDLLEGETLETRRLRTSGLLQLDEALDVADQALDALAAAHDKGIVHRDVKPENIFLTKGGEVKLFDFGLAQMRDVPAEATKTGVTIGTPAFMPPEQALGRRGEVDARSDVWGLGATLFTALSGKYVHDAASLHDQLVASATHRARPLREVAPHVPPVVARVIDRALELKMADRWAGAREMQTALRAARAVMPTLETEGPVPSSDRTLALGVPASDPTLEQPAVVMLDGLPSSEPMTPPPRTERLTGTGASGGSMRAEPAPPTPRIGSPHLGSSGSNPHLGSSGSNPHLGSSGSNPHLGSSGAYPSIGTQQSGPARATHPPQASIALQPCALPSVSPPAPEAPGAPASLAGPASLRQRRSARTAVIVSLVLIVACAALGAWGLLRSYHPRL
jgi:serine/threonine-protein kinase